jgi:hypothetical protein
MSDLCPHCGSDVSVCGERLCRPRANAWHKPSPEDAALAALRAEVERLRKALELIANQRCPCEGGVHRNPQCSECIARAALRAEEGR